MRADSLLRCWRLSSARVARLQVMSKLVEKPELYKSPVCRTLRVPVTKAYQITQQRMFDGGSAEEYHQKKAEKRLRQIWRARSVEYDRYVALACAACVAQTAKRRVLPVLMSQEAHQQHAASRRADRQAQGADGDGRRQRATHPRRHC